jgi:catechol 2,3-dioxygenase-like lactoylglutathione lyase family enzyme
VPQRLKEVELMNVQFVASVAPIVRDVDAARSFYRDALGLTFEGEAGDYLFTHELEGTKHFGLWPLSDAANACFGTTQWPVDIPVPQASIEFEVPDVADAASERTRDRTRTIGAPRSSA